jgi:hypothetical protein
MFRNFINEKEASRIIDWVTGLDFQKGTPNRHLDELSKSLKGSSNIFDISNTDLTNYISKFQAVSDVRMEGVPDFINNLITQISKTVGIPTEHVFLQAVDMTRGGIIQKHYDASIDGYINYKCNISVLAEDYKFCIDGTELLIKQGDMYCFEASLYKHWTPEPFNSRRIMLSFGFVLPYEVLKRKSDEPRVRLSQRIKSYFQ